MPGSYTFIVIMNYCRTNSHHIHAEQVNHARKQRDTLLAICVIGILLDMSSVLIGSVMKDKSLAVIVLINMGI